MAQSALLGIGEERAEAIEPSSNILRTNSVQSLADVQGFVSHLPQGAKGVNQYNPNAYPVVHSFLLPFGFVPFLLGSSPFILAECQSLSCTCQVMFAFINMKVPFLSGCDVYCLICSK
jgi:hypothetical protein